jgi:hypothetical protein
VTWRTLGRYAERYLRRAAELRERHLGPDHSVTLDTLHSLAVVVKRDARRGPEAVALLERVHARWAADLGPDHSATLNSLYNLAEAYRKADQLPDAISLLERLRDRQTASGGPDPDHPEVVKTLYHLGSMYTHAGAGPTPSCYSSRRGIGWRPPSARTTRKPWAYRRASPRRTSAPGGPRRPSP